MTKELDLIELFAPQEILQDFDFEKLVDENGIYRIYMVEKDVYKRQAPRHTPCTLAPA